MSPGRSVPDRRTHRTERHRYLSGCALSAVAGAALAVQSRINGDFGRKVHDGILVALISFGSSLLLCVLFIAVLAVMGRAGALFRDVRTRTLPPWYYIGGIAGAYTIVSQGEAVASLGVAIFTIAAVAGQSVSSLLIDRVGLGPAGRQPLSVFRLVGTGLAIVAVIVAVSGHVQSPRSIGLIALPALAGILTPVHQALNGQIRAKTDRTLAATSINFLVGTAVLLPAFGIDVALRGAPAGLPTLVLPAYLGGPLGVIFIAITVTVVRTIGVLVLALATVAGQLVTAIVLTVVAPEAGRQAGPTTYIGTALTIVAVAVAVARRPR